LHEQATVTDNPISNEPPRPAVSPPTKRPALLRATAAEVVGASMHVAGLTVLDRSIKQLDRMGLPIILASDGSCTLPKYLPPSVLLRKVPRPDDLAALRLELPSAVEIGANQVRPSSQSLEGGIKVVDNASRKRAETAVFGELMRGDLGFVARYLNKPVSFFITRHVLCHLPFSPNHVTLGAALVGLCGAALIASGNFAFMVWGFFLAHVQSILDGCDGELARVRFQQSAIGEWLDTLVDDGLNILIFAALGIGVYRSGASPWFLAGGIVAAVAHVFYDAVALTEIKRQGEGGEIIKVRWRIIGRDDMKARLSRSTKITPMIAIFSLGRRDFYVLAFLVYALLGASKLAVIHALLIAVPLAGMAAVQVIWRLRGSPR
jgi:phosphatidylglycerophosphate synthase